MYLGMSTDDQWLYAAYAALQPRGDDSWQNIVDYMIHEIETYLQFFALL